MKELRALGVFRSDWEDSHFLFKAAEKMTTSIES